MRCLLLVAIVALFETTNATGKIVCYFTNWSTNRKGGGKYEPSDINPNLCTHIIYAFAILDDTLHITSSDPSVDLEEKGGKGYYKKVTGLRQLNPSLKVLLAVGGGNEKDNKFSQMIRPWVADVEKRNNFISGATEFVQKYGFDGLDIDWEFPGPGDKDNFAIFIKELKTAFTTFGLMVTMAAAAAEKRIDMAYDVPSLSRYLDHIHVMAYDYHGAWEDTVHHHAPLHANDTLNDVASINYWLYKGAPASKLFLGIPMYGRGWTLADPRRTSIGSAAVGPSNPGEYTRARRTLAYYEVCTKHWTIVQDLTGNRGPYAYGYGQWVGYDDPAMVKKKCEYIKSRGIGGAMIWSLDHDDFKGTFCSQGPYPLLTTIQSALDDTGSNGESTQGNSSGEHPLLCLVQLACKALVAAFLMTGQMTAAASMKMVCGGHVTPGVYHE